MNYKKYREGKYTVRIYINGIKQWFVNGKLHREDAPAVEYADGSKEWFFNDKLHREDGPAAEYYNGTKGWYVNGKLHREDGPAVEYVNGYKEWWLNGSNYSKEEYYLLMWNNLSRQAKLDYVYGL